MRLAGFVAEFLVGLVAQRAMFVFLALLWAEFFVGLFAEITEFLLPPDGLGRVGRAAKFRHLEQENVNFEKKNAD